MRAKDYRYQAQQQMHSNYGSYIFISLLHICLILFLVPFGNLLLGGALSVGLAAFYLNIARSGKANIKLLFSSFTGDIANTFVMDILRNLFLILWALVPFAGVFITFVKRYSYAMAPYILVDNPEMNGCDAITASRTLMKGKKFKLFCLELSYIGWDILSIFTLGILQIWIVPRKAVARAAFYDSIKNIPAALEEAPDEAYE